MPNLFSISEMQQERLTFQQIEHDRQSLSGDDPKRLEHFGYKVFSQSDEDGILEEIFNRIGTTNRVFVEFGVEIGEECNTRYLLEQGWSGLWIEYFPDYAAAIRGIFSHEIAQRQLKFIEAAVTAENINDLIASAGITGEIDLLSIDIDSNDYHVYQAISVVQPRVLCLEHNAGFPPPKRYIMPYDPDYHWDCKSGEFGASITDLEELANQKGMALVGCGLYSPNGFYVRQDLINPELFSQPCSSARFFRPSNSKKIFAFPRDEKKLLSLLHHSKHRLNQSIATAQAQLESAQTHMRAQFAQLEQYPKTQIEQLQAQLQLEHETLAETQRQLEITQSELKQVRQRLQALRSKTKQKTERLKRLKDRFHQLQAEITSMQNSRFWRLRGQLLRLKRLLKIT